MYVHESFEKIFQIDHAVIAIGTFDGMHLAHRYLVKKVCRDAMAAEGTSSVVVSFSSNPKKVFDHDCDHKVLTTKKEKIEIFEEIGVNHLIIPEFSPKIAAMTYDDFICLLLRKMGIRKIILGYNHRFGKNREGCYETLLPLGEKFHFEVESIEKQTIDGIDISSSTIRQALLNGDIETANILLGYPYSVRVRTVCEEGREQGEFFFDPDKLLPKNGRYVVEIDGEVFSATVKQPEFTIDAINKKNGVYKIEYHALEYLFDS